MHYVMVLELQYFSLDSQVCVLVVGAGEGDGRVEGRRDDFDGQFSGVDLEGGGSRSSEDIGF